MTSLQSFSLLLYTCVIIILRIFAQNNEECVLLKDFSKYSNSPRIILPSSSNFGHRFLRNCYKEYFWFKHIKLDGVDALNALMLENYKPNILIFENFNAAIMTLLVQINQKIDSLNSLIMFGFEVNNITFKKGFLLSPAAKVILANKDFSRSNWILSSYEANFLKEDTTKRMLGTWSLKNGLKVNRPFSKCCFNLKGYKIRAVYNKLRNTVNVKILNNRTIITGLYGEIFVYIVQTLGLRIEKLYKEKNNKFGLYAKNQSTGSILEVSSRKADIGIGAFTYTENRIKGVDYLIGVTKTIGCVMYRNRDNSDTSYIKFISKPFSTNSWILILTSFFLISLFSIFFEFITDNKKKSDSFINFFGLFFSQGISFGSKKMSGKTYHMTVMLFGTIIIIYYSSKIVANKSTSSHGMIFDSLQSLVDHELYFPILMKGSARHETFKNSDDPVYKKVMKKIMDNRDVALVGLNWVKIVKEKNTAFIGSFDSYNYYQKNFTDLVYFRYTPKVNWNSFILSKNSILTSVFNNVLMNMRESGVLQKLISKYQISKDTNSRKMPKEIEIEEINIIFICFFQFIAFIIITKVIYSIMNIYFKR